MEYPAEVRKYLKSGTGVEITDELTVYAEGIMSAETLIHPFLESLTRKNLVSSGN